MTGLLAVAQEGVVVRRGQWARSCSAGGSGAPTTTTLSNCSLTRTLGLPGMASGAAGNSRCAVRGTLSCDAVCASVRATCQRAQATSGSITSSCRRRLVRFASWPVFRVDSDLFDGVSGCQLTFDVVLTRSLSRLRRHRCGLSPASGLTLWSTRQSSRVEQACQVHCPGACGCWCSIPSGQGECGVLPSLGSLTSPTQNTIALSDGG